MSQPTFVDVFAGAGGFAQGFMAEHWNPVLAVEMDSDAAATYASKIGDDLVVNADVAHVSFRRVEADAIVAGLPCQGFTMLGRRGRVGPDPRNQMWRHLVRAVRSIRPRYVVVENTPRFLETWHCARMRGALHREGYRTAIGILDARNFGVSQRRRRGFVLGARGRDPPAFPEPTVEGYATVRDAIGHLPRAISYRGLNTTSRHGPKVQERILAIPIGGCRKDLPRRLQPECWKDHESGSHDVMGRLRWDKPAVTIRTEFVKPEKGRFLHPTANRTISLREGALLQGFPEPLAFKGGLMSVARQIGNAVPPPVAAAVAARLAEDT